MKLFKLLKQPSRQDCSGNRKRATSAEAKVDVNLSFADVVSFSAKKIPFISIYLCKHKIFPINIYVYFCVKCVMLGANPQLCNNFFFLKFHIFCCKSYILVVSCCCFLFSRIYLVFLKDLMRAKRSYSDNTLTALFMIMMIIIILLWL